jgi:hypothetical protein
MNARQEFLKLRAGCPQCEKPRAPCLQGPDEARFQCGAHFSLSDVAGFVVIYPCPARSLISAHLWNIETAGAC